MKVQNDKQQQKKLPTTATSSTKTNNSIIGNNDSSSTDIKVLDILAIDWKGLIQETKKPIVIQRSKNHLKLTNNEQTEATSTLRARVHTQYLERHSTIALLNRVGWSHQLAGPELTSYIQRQLKEKIGRQYVPMCHPVPAIHCYYREKRENIENIFGENNMGDDHDATDDTYNSDSNNDCNSVNFDDEMVNPLEATISFTNTTTQNASTATSTTAILSSSSILNGAKIRAFSELSI